MVFIFSLAPRGKRATGEAFGSVRLSVGKQRLSLEAHTAEQTVLTHFTTDGCFTPFVLTTL